jgi:hypothetical protein
MRDDGASVDDDHIPGSPKASVVSYPHSAPGERRHQAWQKLEPESI